MVLAVRLSRRSVDAMPKVTATLSLLLLGCLLSIGHAVAQSVDEAILNAVSHGTLPPGAVIVVRPFDNSEANMSVKVEFERVLRKAGHQVGDRGPVMLSFDTRDRVDAWTNRDRRYLLELQGQGGPIGRDEASVKLNLYDSATGGVLNRGQGGGTSIVTPSSYRMDVTLEMTESAEVLWQAWITADLQHSDALSLTKSMVAPVIRSLGSTVRRQGVRLQ